MANLSVSVIIPSFEGRALLERNLPSLFTALGGLNHEVLVSDDGSSDDTIEFIREHYPQVHLVIAPENQGFSVAVNRALYRASKDLVLLLNNDVRLSEAYFTHNLDYFSQENMFGVVGSIQNDNGKLLDAAKYPELGQGNINASVNFKSEKDVALPSLFLSGSNALVDRKKLLIIGGLCELFSPFYWEDVDLGLRAWRMGWQCWYEPQSVCYHATSATIHKVASKGKIKAISDRNKLIIHYLHLQGLERLMWTLSVLVRVSLYWVLGRKSFYKGYFRYMKMRSAIRNERCEFSRTATKSLKQVKSDILSLVGDRPIEKF